jgi:hypothetical protein
MSHLDILTKRFPGETILTIEEVAQVLRKEKKTIQNRISEKTFPCRVFDGGVSIIELARHMDENAVYKPVISETAILPTVAVIKGSKKKVGAKVQNPELDELLVFWNGVLFEIEKLDAQDERHLLTEKLAAAKSADVPKPTL